MKRIHFISGLIITIFVGAHLFNHLMGLIGETEHIETMDSLRIIYRNIFVESIILIAVFLQIITGLKLFFTKRKTVNSFFEKLQIWTGMYLAIFLIIHVSAVLGGRLILNLDTNIYFGAAGLNAFPFNLFFLPYYALAIISFFGHISAIHGLKMRKIILGVSPKMQSLLILTTGVTITIMIFYGLLGIEIPEAYNILIGK